MPGNLFGGDNDDGNNFRNCKMANATGTAINYSITA